MLAASLPPQESISPITHSGYSRKVSLNYSTWMLTYSYNTWIE